MALCSRSRPLHQDNFEKQVKLTHCCQVKECIVCHRKRIICHFRCYRSPYQKKTFAGICFVEGAAQLFRGGERNNQSHQILLWSFWNFDLWKQTNQPQPKNMTKCVDSPASAPDQRHWLRSSVDPPVYGLTHDHCLLETLYCTWYDMLSNKDSYSSVCEWGE